MVYLQIALFVIGVAILVVGYRGNRRNLLLAAAIVLFLSTAIGDFTNGFTEGFQHGWSQTRHAGLTT